MHPITDPGCSQNDGFYTGLAGYEAIVNGMPEYNSLGNQFPGMKLPLN